MQGLLFLSLMSQFFCLPGVGMSFGSVECVPKEHEDETLISEKVDIGFYGGTIVKFSQLNDEFACLVGGRGGFIINHLFVIGGAGYGLTNEIEVSPNNSPYDYYLDLGYGGVFFEFVFPSNKLVHLSVHSLIGGGGADYRDYYYDEPFYSDAFFIAEPGADLELNVSSHFRIGLGGSYRLVSGIHLDGLSNGSVGGPAGALTFKFGHF